MTNQMNIQQQWDELCQAFEKRDWETVEILLPHVDDRLNAGETPVLSRFVSDAFNLAMARAGVEYIRSHFTKTHEWPTLDDDGNPQGIAAE